MGQMSKLWKKNGTVWFLEQFGLWANQPAAIQLGYPKQANFVLMQGGVVSQVRIDDDVASFIHESLNELGERYDNQKQLLISFYVKRRNLDKAAAGAGVKRAKGYELLKKAEAWMDCKLHDYFKHTEAQRALITINLRTKRNDT